MEQDRRLRDGKYPARQLFLAWLAICSILLITGISRLVAGQFPDPDDVLRLVQVRDLLAGQNWFDPVQYRIAPPEGTPMHWSRLVDLPLLGLIGLLTPLFGQPTAETIALIAVPLLTFGITAAAIGRLAWRLFDTRIAVLAILACGFLPALLFQFQPMRIDHHGWQVASVAVALWAISWREPRRGGWAAGLAIAFGLSISLEILPMAGAFGGVLFLRWWLNQAKRAWLVAYMQALSLGLFGFYMATRGLSTIAYCDAVSLAHIAFFLIAGLGTWTVARVTRLRGIGLILLFVPVVITAAGAFALVSPTCLATPFAQLDPAVDYFWYRRVLEGQPMWMQPPAVAIPAIIQMLAATGATLVLRARSLDWVRRWWTDYLLVLIASFALAIMVARSLAFTSIIAAIPLGWLAASLIERVRSGGLMGRVGALFAFLLLLAPYTPVTVAIWLLPPERALAVRAGSLQEAACAIRNQAPLLNALPSGVIFAPLDIGPTLLLRSDHAVIATGHHRAEAAMADVIAAFRASPDKARKIVSARGADYLALCTDLTETKLYAAGSPDSLAALLASGGKPDWLDPVDVGANAQFRVFRVKD